MSKKNAQIDLNEVEALQNNEKELKRRYASQIMIESDLFKSSIENAHKNMAWSEGDVRLETVPHVHFFRTYDSDGKKMTATNAVAGHFHNVVVKEQENGPVQIVSVSPAMRMVRKKVKGKFVQVAEPLPEILEDHHTHSLEYVLSASVNQRVKNAMAAQFEGHQAMKIQKLDGVIG